jgi:hypothetical protein
LHGRAIMWLEAILLKDDLAALLAEFTPITIRLGDDGELFLSDPREISLVSDVGLRFVCTAKVHWSVLGIAVHITIHSVTALFRPELAERDGVRKLVFRVEIEHADFAGLPTMVDNHLTELVNRELSAKQVELAWNYTATLSHVFDLPDALRPLERLELTVEGAKVKATPDALGLAIQIGARVLRGTK